MEIACQEYIIGPARLDERIVAAPARVARYVTNSFARGDRDIALCSAPACAAAFHQRFAESDVLVDIAPASMPTVSLTVAHAAACREDARNEESEMSEATGYVLGSDDTEIARLDAQASSHRGRYGGIGARAGQLLRQAGFADVSTFGIQAYFAPSDPTGPMLCAGVARSLAAQIVAQDIAGEAELGLETLEERIAEQVAARDAVVLAPTVVGAWGTRPADGRYSADRGRRRA